VQKSAADVTGFTFSRIELTSIFVLEFAMNRFSFLLVRYLITALSLLTFALPAKRAMTSVESDSSPAMERLVKTFGGEWTVAENFERSDFFPNGGVRKGIARFSLGTGGTTLIEDYHSDGSAGRLDFLAVIWWDKEAKLYRFFTCANDVKQACKLRGTAHWEGDAFVNDYEEMVAATKTKFQDSFVQITPTSFTLIAAIAASRAPAKPLITTKYNRR
jgi:hypothetical protein